MEYEKIISQYNYKQLVFERIILIKQYQTLKKQLSLLDEEYKRRLKDGSNV